jgi:ABC-type multidrug transport system ATPase subunit
MRTIATLQEPDSGSISLGTLDVVRQKEEVRKVLGYLPQEFGVYPKVSVEAMLQHLAVLKGLGARKQRNEVVAALLAQTNLYEVRKRNLGTLSGGMKQRFGIAQALLGDPKLVIVDEPTAGLDPAERLRFHNLLAEIGENVVVVLSTHIVEDVSDLCRRMAIIAGGRVLQEGDPQEAIERLRGRVWRRVVAGDEARALKDRKDVILTRLVAGRHVVHVLADGSPGEGFEPAGAGLEEVYFSTLNAAQRAAAA